MGIQSRTLPCCGAERHEWDRLEVERHWVPTSLRCLIVGENPGDTTSEHFYQRPACGAADGVAVRRGLLRGLYERGLVAAATLDGFREAGFLFDHAIRCQLPAKVVASEREKAKRYACRIASGAHLRQCLGRAQVVWVMGHLASNAVANATAEFPREMRKISQPPYPGEITPSSKFFVSEYVSWRTEGKASVLAAAFKRFAEQRGIVFASVDRT
jgi:hypothetical protein